MTDRVLPFSTAAKAYGNVRPLVVRPVPQAKAVAREQSQDTLSISAAAKAKTEPTNKLAAAKVAAPIDFDVATPVKQASAHALYTNPADRNAAATGVTSGRIIDTLA